MIHERESKSTPLRGHMRLQQIAQPFQCLVGRVIGARERVLHEIEIDQRVKGRIDVWPIEDRFSHVDEINRNKSAVVRSSVAIVGSPSENAAEASAEAAVAKARVRLMAPAHSLRF